MENRNYDKILQIAIVSSEYNQLFLQLKRLYTDEENRDKKEAHRLQDIIYRKFIQDIMDKRLENIQHIQALSSQINDNVIKYDVEHEY
jgi:hypothetical protein